MKVDELIKTTITGNNKKHYEEYGYFGTAGKTEIFVKPDELPENSHCIEKRICDCCGKEYYKTHQKHLRTYNSFKKDVCPECEKNDKDIQSHKIKKGIITSNKKHGTDYPSQDDKVKQLKAKNYFEKTGYTHPFFNPEVREKIKKTNIERYGDACPLKNPKINAKRLETLKKNGNVPTSKQQLKVFDNLKEIYGEEKVFLNYQLSDLFLDIAIILDNIKIDVEYDGYHWHRDKRRDFRRDWFVKKEGFRVIRIKSSYKIPSNEQLKQAINKIINEDIKFIKIILDDYKE